MKLADHFKRAFSAVFNENKDLAHLSATLIATAATAVGTMQLIDVDPETTSSASAAVRQAAVDGYKQEFASLKNPARDESWNKLDARAKNLADRLMQDERLAEADIGALMPSFEATLLQAPPYPWLKDQTSPNGSYYDLSYLNECRAELPGKAAGEVYACATHRESSNETWVIYATFIGGVASFIGLGLFGSALGGRWDRERKKRLLDEEAEKNPPPAPAPELPLPPEAAQPAPKTVPKLRLY